MIQTLSLYDFREAFHRANRANQFSYAGLEALFDYLEEVDPSYDLDVIGLCCDYSEETPKEIAKAYDIELPDNDDEIEHREIVRDYLENHTSVVGETQNSIIYCSSF